MPRLAVLGLGSIGLRHARNAQALGCTVIGVDPDPARRALAEDAGCTVTADRTAAIAAAEAVVIATPTACHAADLAEIVAAGRHAFVEKPLSHQRDGIAELLAAAERAGLLVFVALNLRFHPCAVAAREVIARGGIGKPLSARFVFGSYLPGWRPHQDYRQGYAADPQGGGVLLDLIHEFDLANFLLGPAETVAAAACRTGLLDMPTEDCADAVLRHRDGAQSNIHVDYVTRPRRRTIEIGGSAGLLALDLNERSLRQFDTDGAVVAERRFDGGYDDDYRAEMAGFLACLAGSGQPACAGREALAVLDQVLAARRLSGLGA